METRLNSLVYPIHGFIRSEFDGCEQMREREKLGGQKVKVGKNEWRIIIMKECSERTDNVDFLAVILKCCSNLDGDSSIKLFFNFQLISCEKKGKNHVWNDSSVTEYTENSISWGPYKFLKWEQLLNGGWLKDGKIVVECAFRIDSEDGIPRRSIDFTEERPNTKDIEMICGVEEDMKSKRIEESIDVSRIDEDGIFTETYFINGIPFKIELSKRKSTENVAQLVICSFLNWDDKSEWWRCETEYNISILNENNKKDNEERVSSMFHKNLNNEEYHEFLEWNELIDPNNGYVKDGKIVIQAFVHIVTLSGFDKKTGQGYVQPMKKMTDDVLKVRDLEFYISKKILSQQSSYFSDLFSRDGERNVYSIIFTILTNLHEDIYFDDLRNLCYRYRSPFLFINFMDLAHNRDPTLDEYEIESVLELAEKWGAPEVIERCDAVLKRMELTDTMKMLKLVDKYNLPELRRRFLLKLKDEEVLKSVVNNPRYKTLKDSLKVAILEWRLVPEELQTEEKEETDYQFNTDFKRKSQFSDVEIKVEGYKYHASKQILANASVFFMKRFYGPYSSDESQIKILKVSPLQFETLLTHIYHPTRPVTCASLDSLLSLSKQFSVHILMDKCEEYLILNNTLPLIQKLEYAGKYELPLLLSACLNLIEKEKSVQEILNHPNVGALSSSVVRALSLKDKLLNF